ncbi:MAG: EAL domain-containing protein [Actinomycetota bacterium]|nr:EAL domain-containing protein [Actinomycetota bacterium]
MDRQGTSGAYVPRWLLGGPQRALVLTGALAGPIFLLLAYALGAPLATVAHPVTVTVAVLSGVALGALGAFVVHTTGRREMRLLGAQLEELAALVEHPAHSPAPRQDDRTFDRSVPPHALPVTTAYESVLRALAADKHVRSLAQRSPEVISIIERDGKIRFQSPSIETVLGYKAKELIGTCLSDLFVTAEEPADFMKEIIETPGRELTRVVREMRHRDGSTRQVEIDGVNLLGDPSVDGIMLNMRDVTSRKKLEEKLEHDALHDPLTGLANRSLLIERLGVALARHNRTGALFALVLLDLDGFKTFNDSLGHTAGDELLVSVAARLREGLRETDMAARLGGDEFALLIEGIRSPEEIVGLAERVVAQFRHPFTIEQREVFVHASLGIALGTAEHTSALEVIRDADLAMDRVKDKGRSRYAVFEPSMHTAALNRLELTLDLRRAIDAQEFVIHYQPIVEMDRSRIIGVEALVRWNHPKRGLLPPNAFIGLAEETGLIGALEDWIMVTACRQMRVWQKRYPSDPLLAISINLSARHLQQPHVVEDITEALAVSGLDPSSLILEITESIFMREMSSAVAKLEELKALGLRLAIDDFGTGYSSLSRIRDLPIDVLKIDKSFVDGVAEGTEDSALARAIIKLGRSLDLSIIAEGVERPEQFGRLRTLHCEYAQGYYFARPLDAEQMERQLEDPQLEMNDPRLGRFLHSAPTIARGP